MYGILSQPIVAHRGWRCKGIFSTNYLKRYLHASDLIPKPSECEEIHTELRALWLKNLAGLRNNNEAFTRTQFLDVVLNRIGWYFIPEQPMPIGKLRKRPDYCLFPDEATQQKAAEEKNILDVFRRSTSVLEAKKAEYPLDQKEDKKTDTLGMYPSQQVQQYLSAAKDDRNRFFDWAILTNGNEWRLYCENAPVDAYFAFDLAQDDHFCPLDDFCLFVAFFSRTAFDRNNGRCLLDDFREQSLTHQEELETKLRRRIFDVLEELAEGFYLNPINNLTPDDFPVVYDNALIFLYRLLFILYAESRGLLPTKSSGPQSNARYRNDFSLQRFTHRLLDAQQYPDDFFDRLYKELGELFHLINGTDAKKNEQVQVTRYNGGLFNPTKHPLLEQWRIGDKTLAKVLRQLVFAQLPSRGRNGQQSIQPNETVDYGTLEVRQLGDIYEGLLGHHLILKNNRIELVNDKDENHSKGIFYTPDWIVNYLIRETLQPLLDVVEVSPEVTAAMKGQSKQRRQDNSFALGVLNLNIVDPAMGSGHFLVRATEWLAEQIVYHPTTCEMTETVTKKMTREAIIAADKTPIPPGVSREDAETAYWRRRVVENCIYGVDTNTLAVELAKLSLWLTCIAIDEPLSFLDHHLRDGNSLLSVAPEDTNRLPVVLTKDEKKQEIFVDIGDALKATLHDVIDANLHIEQEASTEMDVVKNKEQKWRDVQDQLEPFRKTLNLWFAALDGLKVKEDALNAFDYRIMALYAVKSPDLQEREIKRAEMLWESVDEDLTEKMQHLCPFHWRVEFPAVFYQPDGSLKLIGERGFDAVLGNPPYISTQTSSDAKWRNVLGRRAGFLEDLYVHFTDLGFSLLRHGGGFGFIVADTFFTIDSKERMRDRLLQHRLTHLGQCHPFEATVDAAIFVAKNEPPQASDTLLFIQANPHAPGDEPERDLEKLPAIAQVEYDEHTEDFGVRHGQIGCLRVHRMPITLYNEAFRRVFFEPRPAVLNLYSRFNEPVKALVNQWWDSIEDSKKFAQNLESIREYHETLKPGDVTLVGLIAEGGQGLATANNARFLAYLDGTERAKSTKQKRILLTQQWLAHATVGPVFRDLLAEYGGGGELSDPVANSATWEVSVEALRSKFRVDADLGFGRTDLYKIISPSLVADASDFAYSWTRRRAELLSLWRTAPELRPFWTQTTDDANESEQRAAWRDADNMADDDFCRLCVSLHHWAANANKKEAGKRVKAMGLRSSEFYDDAADVTRIAVIYNGFYGARCWLPYSKGDSEGNRWVDNQMLYIDWSCPTVNWLFGSSGKSGKGMPVMRNPQFYLLDGVSWSDTGNHVPLKSRLMPSSVNDVKSMRLNPVHPSISAMTFLAILNSNVFSFFCKKYINNTAMYQMNDIRQLPIVIPTPEQGEKLSNLSERAVTAKKLTFSRAAVPPEMSEFCRSLGETLRTSAPAYLRPSAQHLLLADAKSCLQIIELAVQWEAEKLYGVEGLGPFDEF